jgi:hypothetical protein
LPLKPRSNTSPINRVAVGDVPLSLEEKVRAAQRFIDVQLGELDEIRKEISRMNNEALRHMNVLRNIRDNYLQ